MTSFVQPDFSLEHPGVVRAQNLVAAVKSAAAGFDSTRGAASLLLAAVVSAMLVVANQIIDTWSEGHLMVAWVALWLVAFAALALLASPARRAIRGLQRSSAQWTEARAKAESDARFWDAAQNDARMMAELSHAMSRQGRDLRFYY